ncbi:hypothetical protein [Streptomyces fulvoviolaceus]|uniref:hypothetical protein n=1 Tax=Streptomyces fulvoviolaceus TaxID=285535 RepID=UPI0021C09DFD|nr:hypothetical protein [Streptomyces fulvoviolaceus]MCT9080448.1 hypothetical protein [Streptomyces fulvoviolaceus]
MSLRRLLGRAAGAVAVATAARHGAGAWAMHRTLAAVDRPRASAAGTETGGAVGVVHFIVPVLREQQHIRGAVDWFAPLLRHIPGSTLTFVTTSREHAERAVLAERIAARSARLPAAAVVGAFPELTDTELKAVRTYLEQQTAPVSAKDVVAALETVSTTDQVVDALLTDDDVRALPIRHVHYTGTGRKAAQVNHAAATLPPMREPAYLAVYDIDSRPGQELIERTWASIAAYAAQHGGLPGVVQQSARFTCGSTSPCGWERALCRGAARLQTMWTLRREIPAFRRYARASVGEHGPLQSLVRGGGLVQTVGHGLWVRQDVFEDLGGLPTYTVLDDLPFGYHVTVERTPVLVVSQTAAAPGPEDARSLLDQGRRWYANYLDYAACWAEAGTNGRGTQAWRAAALAVGWYRGATWLARTPATATCLWLLLRPSTRLPTRATAATALWLGMVTPVGQLAAADGQQLGPGEQARASAELLAAYLVSSVGPAVAVAQRLTRHRTAMAPKTHRRLPLSGQASLPPGSNHDHRR